MQLLLLESNFFYENVIKQKQIEGILTMNYKNLNVDKLEK